ncbi:MAG: DUF6062 family protein [Candidatus Methylomirabilales bacterium]
MTDPLKRPTKFIAYFDLRDACGEDGCPICTLLLKWSVRTMDHFMYERVTDPGCREELLASRGFCNWHAWMLPKSHHSGSGTAVIHEHLLKKELEVLEGLRRSHKVTFGWRRILCRLAGTEWEPPAVKRRRQKAPCPVCTGARISDEIYLKTCLEFLPDFEFRRAFEKSSGLCLPHVYLAISTQPNHSNLPELLKLQAAKIEVVRAELSAFIRKQDYRFRGELVGEEGSAWLRSIELLAGKAGVFGPDRPRIALMARAPAVVCEVARPEATMSEGRQELHQENEHLRFENEKLRRRGDEITRQWNEESSRAASLHFQVYELAKEKQILEFNLAGARGESKGWEGVVSRLREEIAALQAELRRLKEHASPE